MFCGQFKEFIRYLLLANILTNCPLIKLAVPVVNQKYG